MSTSFSYTESTTFTIAHARHIASKVATDLKRFQRFYCTPADEMIAQYEQELVVLLKHDVVAEVVYGFKRNDRWTEAAARYVSSSGGILMADDDPGKIRPGLDIAHTFFTSFLIYTAKWHSLPEADRTAIKSQCPFPRTTGATPGLEVGVWVDDLNYTAGGRGLGRSVVRR